MADKCYIEIVSNIKCVFIAFDSNVPENNLIEGPYGIDPN